MEQIHRFIKQFLSIIVVNDNHPPKGLYTEMYNVDHRGKLKLINVCTLSIPAIDLAHITRM